MLRAGETYWHCTNRECGKAVACDGAERGQETLACDCGSLMKKEGHATVFSYLDFLRADAGTGNDESKEKEEAPCEK
jgi:hypothetical protein